MKHALFIIALLIPIFSKAQTVEFCPKGADWYFDTGFFGTYSQNHKTYLGDTIVANKLCKKIGVIGSSYYGKVHFIYQTSDSIFGWEKDVAVWDFLFKNNYKKGDSSTLIVRPYGSLGGEFAATIYIDSVETMNFGQLPIKKFYFSQPTPPANSGVIYDLFGPENGFFFKDALAVFDCPSEWIRCYADSIFSQVNLVGGDCEVIPATSLPDFLDEIKYSPNPSTGIVEIIYPNELNENVLVMLYNLNGQLIHFNTIGGSKSNNQLDYSDVPAGIYIITIRSTGSVANRRLVIAH